MNIHGIYEPPPRRPRATLFKRSVRYALWTLIAIPTLYYCIHLYFSAMPWAEKWMQNHQFYLHWVK